MSTPTPLARPADALKAREGRQYIVRFLASGTYLRRPQNEMATGWTALVKQATRVSTVGEAASIASTHPYSLPDEAFEVEPYDNPHSIEADLARMHAVQIERERAEWQARALVGNVMGAAGAGHAARQGEAEAQANGATV